MQGIVLSSLTGELQKVAAPWQIKPALTLKHLEQKFGLDPELLYEGYGSRNIIDCCQRFSIKILQKMLTFDELCKLWHSSATAMDQSVRVFFETSANHEIVKKIISSIWRWGVKRSKWNEVVDAYNCLRKFTFPPIAGFEITLDYTTSTNVIGHSKYSQTYLDGVFAYLVHYKGEHVLTIGFSIMSGREVVIQQIQSAKNRGNRYLYRLPSNRTEFVIALFLQNFPGYALYLADGRSLVSKTLSNYESVLSEARANCKQYRAELALHGTLTDLHAKLFTAKKETCKNLQSKIARLQADEKRICAHYAATGRFALAPEYECRNQLSYRKIVPVKKAALQAA